MAIESREGILKWQLIRKPTMQAITRATPYPKTCTSSNKQKNKANASAPTAEAK
jgi:hypothetical protein